MVLNTSFSHISERFPGFTQIHSPYYECYGKDLFLSLSIRPQTSKGVINIYEADI